MKLKLVLAEDCSTREDNRRKFNKKRPINVNKNDHKIELIKEEDCSTNASSKAKDMTRHERGWAIRLGRIDIPKDDKRSSCKFYNKENNSCLEYPRRHCFNCKENRLPKRLPYGHRFNK